MAHEIRAEALPEPSPTPVFPVPVGEEARVEKVAKAIHEVVTGSTVFPFLDSQQEKWLWAADAAIAALGSGCPEPSDEAIEMVARTQGIREERACQNPRCDSIEFEPGEVSGTICVKCGASPDSWITISRASAERLHEFTGMTDMTGFDGVEEAHYELRSVLWPGLKLSPFPVGESSDLEARIEPSDAAVQAVIDAKYSGDMGVADMLRGDLAIAYAVDGPGDLKARINKLIAEIEYAPSSQLAGRDGYALTLLRSLLPVGQEGREGETATDERRSTPGLVSADKRTFSYRELQDHAATVQKVALDNGRAEATNGVLRLIAANRKLHPEQSFDLGFNEALDELTSVLTATGQQEAVADPKPNAASTFDGYSTVVTPVGQGEGEKP